MESSRYDNKKLSRRGRWYHSSSCRKNHTDSIEDTRLNKLELCASARLRNQWNQIMDKKTFNSGGSER